MHRMRSLVAKVGLSLLLASTLGETTFAELIKAPGGPMYPDIAASISGSQQYTYDPATRTGVFQVTTTPYLLSTGPSAEKESIVQPNGDGVRTQSLNLTLDNSGQLINNPNNSYALYGTVSVGGQTFQGLLLQGKPTAFGSQGGGSSAFNLDLKVTGGALAATFGPDLYLELHPALDSTFDGSFTKNFSTTIRSSNTLGYRAPPSIPEPTTLVVLLACGTAVFLRRHRPRFVGFGRRHS